jgi:hypothetical protein
MNIKKINRSKRLAKARNMRKNNRVAEVQMPMLGNMGWSNYKSYLNGFKKK